jgi:phosphatidylinositol-3-phosphatase
MKEVISAHKVFTIGLLIILAGCGSSSPNSTTTPPPPTASVPRSNHVVIVALENHSFEQVIGNPEMPYFNGLASQYGLAEQYFANVHDSLKDLMYVTAGASIVPGDSTLVVYNVDNIARQMAADGRSWKVYAEALPSIGYLGYNTGLYMRHHNPFAYFSDDQVALRDNMVPFGPYFMQDVSGGTLPEYSYVVPDISADAHSGTVAQADAWMSSNLPPLLQSSQFKQDGILFIFWDEGAVSPSDERGVGGRVANIVVGPRVKPGYKSSVPHNHLDLLATVCAAMQLSACPGGGATGIPMAEFFQ